LTNFFKSDNFAIAGIGIEEVASQVVPESRKPVQKCLAFSARKTIGVHKTMIFWLLSESTLGITMEVECFMWENTKESRIKLRDKQRHLINNFQIVQLGPEVIRLKAQYY
jgi:hypothetical protein